MSGFGSLNNGGFGAPTPAFGGGGFGGGSNGGGGVGSSSSGYLPNNNINNINSHPPPPQQQQQPMFGSASAAMTGFGTAQPFSTQQQQPQQQQPAVMFGSSPNVASTLTSAMSGGFGGGFSAPSTFATNTNQFHDNSGSNNNHYRNSLPFGTQPQIPFASSTNMSSMVSVNTPHNTMQPPQYTPFGSSSTAATAPTFSMSTSMMTSTSTATQPPPFRFSTSAQQPTTTFPTASSSSSSMVAPNPFAFGNTPQQQPPINHSMAFGMSSNVMNTNTLPPSNSAHTPFVASTSIMQQHNSTAPNNTPFASRYSSNSPVPNPFGTTTATPFQINQNISDGMSDDDIAFAPAMAATASNPFGAGQPPAPPVVDSTKVNELVKLQAKIAAKKKKIEEKKLRETTAAAEAAANEASASLRASATPFVPLSSSTTIDTAIVAQRNAIRFAESNDTITRSQLPSDLLDQQSADVIAAQTALRNSGGSGGRENLENAVSLVGTCIYMCPDEELLRREREGDIQLLERPDVQIHPSTWTLRDTMVKRFRRSAADYKLDVPEWIRPPDILEKVCGYLEEWVMERDRQGPDPRYKNVPSPPPLDVYQFVWDRTRMVRKDFILQNFVGTGGLVDARAVRCHERIARWHCLCEHQLSHISEYVLNQSQQNVQELGQTMKTLNQFYDDSMGRALREVPDDTGSETRTNFAGFAHGCGAESVQGQPPIDYDGTTMVNDANHVANRLIGAHAVESLHHGTAEPEMRGLYILLTIDNDGGMEVNKYASRLYEERPEVYHTRPVQLALSVYKAKIDRNYAKFFSILRSSSTPYLFACLMFKHVASMRKNAIFLMHRTYGGKHKDGSNIYDTYPLRHLTTLLCFEDDDEARTACRHYNITIKTEENGIDMIYWKTTSFREAKDPEKGTIISLRPRKMIKTIEGKLKGATRLAVCRGELSGTESYLSPTAIQVVLARNNPQANSSTVETPNRNEYLRHLKEVERKQQDEHFEARQQEIIERKKRDELQRLADLEMRRKHEDEMKRRVQREEQQQRQAQLQLEREELEKKRQEQKLRLEREEQQRVEKELLMRHEAERQKKIELERQEVLRLQREIQIKEDIERNRRVEEEREQQRVIELERIRKERAVELARQQEKQRMMDLLAAQELERKRREAERLQLLKEKREKLDATHKIAHWIWCILKRQQKTTACRINDSLSALKSHGRSRSMIMPVSVPKQMPLRAYDNYIDNLGASLAAIFPSEGCLNSLLASKICAKFDAKKYREGETTILLTIAFIFPIGGSVHEQQICRMIQTWLQSRFTFNQVCVYCGNSHNVRIVIVNKINLTSTLSTCDAAIFIVPPPLADNAKNRLVDLRSLSSFVDDDVPRLSIAFFDRCKSANIRENSSVLSDVLSGQFETSPIIENIGTSVQSLEESVLDFVGKIGNVLVIDDIQNIDRMSVIRIVFRCVSSTLWMEKIEKREDIGRQAAVVTRNVLKEILAAGSLIEPYASSWPSKEFTTTIASVPLVADYFSYGSHLPMNWGSTEQSTLIGNKFMEYSNLLEGPFSTAIHQLIIEAPHRVREKCQNLMDQQFLKRCLQAALQWRMSKDEGSLDCTYVYLPAGMTDDVIHRTISSLPANDLNLSKAYSIPSQKRAHDIEMMDTDLLELIDRPPQETPNTSKVSATKRLRFSDSFAPVMAENQRPTSLSDSQQSKSPSIISTEPKRRRTTPKERKRDASNISKRVSDSLSFTKKLNNLLQGNTCVDLMIGNSFFLSTALRDAPPLITEMDDTRHKYDK